MAPALYAPVSSPGPTIAKRTSGEDRPDDANEPKELYEEDAPDLA
jgi:hypothetical protein